MDDIRPLPGGQRRREDGVVLGGLEGNELDLDPGVALLEHLDHLVIRPLVFHPPTPKREFHRLLPARGGRVERGHQQTHQHTDHCPSPHWNTPSILREYSTASPSRRALLCGSRSTVLMEIFRPEEVPAEQPANMPGVKI